MKFKSGWLLGLTVAAMLLAGDPIARADAGHYGFQVGQDRVYKIVVTLDLPDHSQTHIDYVALHPQLIDAASGQTSLTYDWGVSNNITKYANTGVSGMGANPDWVFNSSSNGDTTGKLIVINAQGKLVRTDIKEESAQLPGEQGPAWSLPLQPLPPAGQSAWSEQRPLRLYEDDSSGPGGFPFGPPGFGGPRFPHLVNPFGPPPTRVETTGTENISYTASQEGNLLTVQRHYDMTAPAGSTDMPNQHVHGEGQYVYDPSLGCVRSLQWNVTMDLTLKNVSVSVPISVNADLVSADDLAKFKVIADADKAEQAELDKEHAALINDEINLPPDMETTQALGRTDGGGPFCAASINHSPVIGFRIKVDSWGDHSAFPVLDPLYWKPVPQPNDPKTVILMAKDGYAVASMTINAGNGVNALCVRFMRIAGDKLDPTDTYVSHWFGHKVGEKQTKLGGDGRFVYGIYGRKGSNYDYLGLVMASGSDQQVDDSTH